VGVAPPAPTRYEKLIQGLLDAAAEALLPDGLKELCTTLVEFATHEAPTPDALERVEARLEEILVSIDRFETDEIEVRRTLARVHRRLAELDRGAASLPREGLRADELDHYRAKARARHHDMPVIGFTGLRVPLTVDALYVPLTANVNLEMVSKPRHSSAELHGHHHEVPLVRAFDEASQRGMRGLVLLGDPGSGKTTHLKQVLLQVLDDPTKLGLPAETLPIFLPLQELRDRSAGLPSFVGDVLTDPLLDLSPGFGQRLCDRKHLLFLFDGLDEVADGRERAEVSRWIADILTSSLTAHVLVSCRFAGYTPDVALHGSFLELELRPLDDEQMQDFVRKWYAAVARFEHPADRKQAESIAMTKSNDLLGVLTRQEFIAITRVYQMTRNPLLLAAICLVHHDQNRLPDARADLYDECIKVLLNRWKSREQQQRQKQQQLANLSIDDRFLTVIRDETGLLTGMGIDVFAFMHLGIQEFLTAKEYRDLGHDDGAVFAQLASKFDDSWWEEVILLMLALPDAPVFGKFMRALVEQPNFAGWASSGLMDRCFAEAAKISEEPFVELLKRGDPRAWWRRMLGLRKREAEALGQRQVAAAQVLARKMPEALEELDGVLTRHPAPAVRTWWSRRRTGAAEVLGRDVIVHEQTGIELVLIPAGSFLMGSVAGDQLGYEDERPQHEVTLNAFYLARTPITNAQYGRYLAAHPDAPKPKYWGDRRFNQPDQPVVGVSCDEAMAYCEWAKLVLPTEAQWEYACRAETTTQYWSGNDESDLERVGWYEKNSGGRLHAVGEKEPNPFGLHDMHGNVWEWCRDGWVDNYKTKPQPGDGLRHEQVPEGARVFRGGSWDDGARDARSACRIRGRPGIRYDHLGFRPAQVIP
jgi:formylglycine-generating enzyme required for sulfatase activity